MRGGDFIARNHIWSVATLRAWLSTTQIQRPARRLLGMFAALVMIGLALSYAAVQSSTLFHVNEQVVGFMPEWNGAGIAAVPAWVCAILLLLGTCLLAIIGLTCVRAADPLAPYWGALGTVLFLVATGEGIQVQSVLRHVAEAVVAGLGPWAGGITLVTLAGLLAGVLARGFQNFFRLIPADTRYALILAAVLFLSGAVASAIGAGVPVPFTAPQDISRMIVFVTLVQGIKMAGALVLIYTLTSYLSRYYDEFSIRVRTWATSKSYHVALLPPSDSTGVAESR